MARKSRRNKEAQTPVVPAALLRNMKEPAAAYVRLSVEENEKDTIDTQLAMLREHIETSGSMYLEDVYIDNGFTGTNFDRPEFMRMMADVRSGRIRCIVVKDLSRFGRNFLETGYYIETLLPKLNARLIAVTDDFDSGNQSDQDALSVPIRNLVNDYYAKDYSKKICDMNAVRRRSGNYTIERAVYGYLVDKEKNEYYVDPATAPVVQMIFRWYLAGVRPETIASRLDLLGITTPMEYRSFCEEGEKTTGGRGWTGGKVRMILSHEIYTGDRVLGRERSALYKNIKRKAMPRESWTIYKDDHDALVTREDFRRAKELMQEHAAGRLPGGQHGSEIDSELDDIFHDMVYCGRCGHRLRLEQKRYADGTIMNEGTVYVCKGRIREDSRSRCRLSIELDLLWIIVNDQIRMMIDLLLEQQQATAKLRRYQTNRNPVYKYRMRIDSLAMKADQCGERVTKLYEDLASGVIEKDDFKALKLQYQDERNKYEEKIAECRKLLREAEETMNRLDGIVSNLKNRFLNVELNRDLLEYMVEKIIVHEERHIEIVFRIEDVFQRNKAIVEGGEGA